MVLEKAAAILTMLWFTTDNLSFWEKRSRKTRIHWWKAATRPFCELLDYRAW
jgi:hypothetical protein